MGSFEWMEVETLSTEITALESRLAAAKSRHNYGLVKVVKEQIAAAQQRRARYLAHITTSLAESLEAPAADEAAKETSSRQRALGQKNRGELAEPGQPNLEPAEAEAPELVAEPATVEAPEEVAEPVTAEASEGPAEPEQPTEATDEPVAVEAAEEPAAEVVAEPVRDEVPEAVAEPEQPAVESAEPLTDNAPEAPAAPDQPTVEPAEPSAASGAALPNPDTIKGVTNVWDQLTPTHIERAKHELGLRRAELLARHAEELKALEAEQSEIDVLAQAIDSFVRKFNASASPASVVRLDEERDRLQSQA
jgi:hypothetical protein